MCPTDVKGGPQAARSAGGAAEHSTGRLLTINTGSSSLKAALYSVEDLSRPEFALEATRIGLPEGSFCARDSGGQVVLRRSQPMPDHGAALQALLDWIAERGHNAVLQVAGHRVVHGGPRYSEPQIVDADLLEALRELVPIDPMHLPQAIAAIEGFARAYPNLPQVACFDTAFHRHMPRIAQMYALPTWVRDLGVMRYGFHGLSYEYIMDELRRIDPAAADGRVVMAHLGNGASMVAVRAGQGIDTTMGFTPTGGLVMGTRTGDLDPGVLLYLLQEQHLSPAQVNDLVNQQSGLLGVSGTTTDMQDLLERRESDPRAAEAVELFCYTARKYLGALAAVLNGLDTLVFTGGIGEHAGPVRAGVCEGMEYLGIELDSEKNHRGESIISRRDSRVTIRVVETDEDAMIARHALRIVRSRGDSRVPI